MDAPDLPHPRVLVVEDDPSIRNLIATVALAADLDVSEASNGAEAARMLAERSYEVITLDLMLPTFSGWELLEQLSSEGCESCIVLVTAASDGELDQIDRSLVFDVIRKPFDIETIRVTLLEAIDKQRQDGSRLHLKPDQPSPPNFARECGSCSETHHVSDETDCRDSQTESTE